jgi:hypothetical protein
VVLNASRLPSRFPSLDNNDDVFFDEKLKANNNSVPEFAPPPRTPGTQPAPEVPWSKRKLKTRHCLIIAAAITLLIIIAVGVGVGVALSNRCE